jgi:hypothetical protein
MSTICVNLSKFSVIAIFLIAGALALSAFARSAQARNVVPGSAPDSSYEEVYTPVMTTTSVMIDDDEEPPLEPNIGQAKFFRYPELTSTSERVDRLLHGINIYVTPEYDQYGHEIRRYMARIGNMKMYEDPEYLLNQYRNVKKAAVIAKFWQNHLELEVSQIESIMEKDETISLSTRTAFRQNKMAVRSFIMSLNSWIDSNEQLMRKIGQDPKLYLVRYPEIIVLNAKDRIDFHNLLSVRAARLKDIQRYAPFSIMVY